MDDDKFDDLLESVKEAGKIIRGEIEPSRKFIWNTRDLNTSLNKSKNKKDIPMKQIITNINNCQNCPLVIWNYDEFGKLIWECDHNSFSLDDEMIIDNPLIIPDWCPLPDKVD